MGKKDPRVNGYIAKAAPFAKPILTHLRKVVHAGCPAVTETMKWRFPHFEHGGILCSMAAFKNHCAFGFWKSQLLFGDADSRAEAMGQFGRITSIGDLPSEKILTDYVRKAARLNETGVKPVSRKRDVNKKAISVPADLQTALAKNSKARKTFENFTYTHKKEYVEWITGAKRPETRVRRLKAAVRWMAQGKPQNWKYL